jgi:hypothetical protein
MPQLAMLTEGEQRFGMRWTVEYGWHEMRAMPGCEAVQLEVRLDATEADAEAASKR